MSLLLLVRHGQASWGAADYDNLSPLGVEQGRLLGAHLAGLGITPTRAWVGGMRRHAQTAEAAITAAGWDVPVDVDADWAEFDHVDLLRVHGDPEVADGMTVADFNDHFDAAVRGWVRDERPGEYAESFADFTGRVERGLAAAAGALAPGETGVVFTSGGPVSWVATHLLGAQPRQWGRLNPVQVNTGTSRLVVGRRGVTLVSLNEQAHLTPETMTYR